MTIEKNITIVFKADASVWENFLKIEKDNDANVNEEGEIKTTFLPGSKAYAKVYGDDYTVESSAGTVKKEKTNKSETKEETFNFIDQKEKTLSYIPDGSLTCNWIGDDCGDITLDGRTITLENESIGVLECEYTTKYDQWSVSWNGEGTVLVVAILEIEDEDKDDLTASVTFEFAEEDEDLDTKLELELDSEENDEKTSFDLSDTVHLRCFHVNPAPRVYSSSSGNITVGRREISVDIEDETIDFENEDSGTLAYLPIGSITYDWIGDDHGNPSLDGRTITLSSKVLGVLKCSYKTKADKLTLSGVSELGKILTMVTQTIDETEYTDSCPVTFSSSDPDDPEPVSYDLNIKDFCDDSNIEGVEVIWDGVSIGSTNSLGVISLGLQVPGSTHSLKMVKTGYIPSNEDKLNNNSVTIPPRIVT